jgi:hypothetical protein
MTSSGIGQRSFRSIELVSSRWPIHLGADGAGMKLTSVFAEGVAVNVPA